MDEAIREARRAAGVLEDYLYPFELYWEIDDPAAREALGVTVGLLERGYSEEDIAKIWGGNFLRVLRAAESLRSSAE